MLSGRQADEIPEIVVRGLRLREAAIRLLLYRMDEVGKLDGILDEEHRDVVADDVPVAFLGVELDRKAAHVARQIGRTLAACNGRKPHKGRRAFAGALEQIGAGELRQRLVVFKKAMRAITSRVNDAFRNPLVVEMKDFFAKMEILKQRGAARADLQRVLVVGNRSSLRRRHDRYVACGDLMQLAALAAAQLSGREWLHDPAAADFLPADLTDLAMKFPG